MALYKDAHILHDQTFFFFATSDLFFFFLENRTRSVDFSLKKNRMTKKSTAECPAMYIPGQRNGSRPGIWTAMAVRPEHGTKTNGRTIAFKPTRHNKIKLLPSLNGTVDLLPL